MKDISSKIQKEINGTRTGFIVGIVILLIAGALFFLGISSGNKSKEDAIHFGQAYNDGLLEEDICVYVPISDEPWEFGSYDNSEYYSYIWDDNDLYILKSTKSELDRIKKEVAAKGSYIVMGTITKLNDEVMDLALEAYNEGEDPENQFTKENFEGYMQGVGLNYKAQTSKSSGLYVLALIVGLFALLIGGLYGLRFFGYSSVIKKLSDAEAMQISGEIDSPQTEYIKKARTYLTPRYIMSFGSKLVFVRYEDIVWAYEFVQRTNFVPTASNIRLRTRDGQNLIISDMAAAGRKEVIRKVFETIYNRNPEVDFGYSQDLIQKYR